MIYYDTVALRLRRLSAVSIKSMECSSAWNVVFGKVLRTLLQDCVSDWKDEVLLGRLGGGLQIPTRAFDVDLPLSCCGPDDLTFQQGAQQIQEIECTEAHVRVCAFTCTVQAQSCPSFFSASFIIVGFVLQPGG